MTGHPEPHFESGWLLVTKTKYGDDEDDFSILHECNVWQLPPRDRSWSMEAKVYCAVLGSAISSQRILDSLQKDGKGVKKKILDAVLNAKASDSLDENGYGYDFNRYLNELNTPQREAAMRSLGVAKHGGLQLIQGPPGTGKTHTISTLLAILRLPAYDKRVLVCAPTNVAMADIAKKFSKRAYEHVQPFDVLVVCSKDRIGEFFITRNEKLLTLDGRIEFLSRRLLQFRAALLEIIQKDTDPDITDEYSGRDISALSKLVMEYANDFRHLRPSNLSVFQLFEEMFELARNFITDNFEDSLKAIIGLKAYSFAKKLILEISAFVSDPASSKRKMEKKMAYFYRTLQEFFLERAGIIFSTINSSMSRRLGDLGFDVVIVDEASQALEAETTLILQRNIPSVILVGDPKQLSATVFSDACVRAGYKRSLFERLAKRKFPTDLLSVQYRMHPDISAFSSRHFYNSRIVDSIIVQKYDCDWYQSFKPLGFFAYQSSSRALPDATGSLRNDYEAELICAYLYAFMQENAERKNLSIGIITPYKAQVAVLQEVLEEIMPKHAGRVDVNTVDGFQGQERDVIILSLTSTGRASAFVEDLKRVNVSCTRAKYALWVFANGNAIDCATSPWKWLEKHTHLSIRDERARNCSVLLPPHVRAKLTAFMVDRKGRGGTKASLVAMKQRLEMATGENSWKIIVTDIFLRDIRYGSYDERLFFFGVVERLKAGNFSGTSRPYEKTEGLAGKLFYAASLARSKAMIWTINIRAQEQVISLMRWVTKTEMASLWVRFKDLVQNYPVEYADACVLDHSKGNRERIYPLRNLDISSGKPSTTVADAKKFYDISSPGILQGLFHEQLDASTDPGKSKALELMLPYLLDETQEEALKVMGSVVLVGRGGTGKTSVLARRLASVQQAALLTEDPQTRSRQLFLTLSQTLVSALLTEYKTHIASFQKICEFDGLMLRTIQDADSFKHGEGPFILSFLELAIELDRSLSGEKFFMLHEDELARRREALLSNTLFNEVLRKARGYRADALVSFETFCHVYFPKASHALKRRFAPHYVMREILAVIKRLKPDGKPDYLSRRDYVIATEKGPLLARSDREEIYSFYENYELQKRALRQFDLVDMTSKLARRLNENDDDTSDSLMKFGNIYIDEVQDLSPIQWLLLKPLIGHHTNLICCGDQAQSIAAGTHFRFSELKALLFNLSGGQRRPSEFHLSINYRTTASILALANRVVDVIRALFPNEIDQVPNEIAGSSEVLRKPRILEEQEDEALLFLFAEEKSLNPNQAILVRSHDEKESLERRLFEMGFQATIFTILEAKGLEFDDVVLYNVLQSPTGADPRVLYHSLPEEKRPHPLPAIDYVKHVGFCQILKELYVGITRARHRLLLVDNGSDRKIFGQVFDEVLEWTSARVEVPFASEGLTGPEAQRAWLERAKQYLAANLLPEARIAFERGGDMVEARRVDAKLAFLEYQSTSVESWARRAVALYLEIGEKSRAAQILSENLGEYLQAGDLFTESGEILKALTCYSDGKKTEKFFKTLMNCEGQVEGYMRDTLLLRCAEQCYDTDTPKTEACIYAIRNHLRAAEFLEKKFLQIGKSADLMMFYLKFDFVEHGAKFFLKQNKLDLAYELIRMAPEELVKTQWSNVEAVVLIKMASQVEHSQRFRFSQAKASSTESAAREVLSDYARSCAAVFTRDKALVTKAFRFFGGNEPNWKPEDCLLCQLLLALYLNAVESILSRQHASLRSLQSILPLLRKGVQAFAGKSAIVPFSGDLSAPVALFEEAITATLVMLNEVEEASRKLSNIIGRVDVDWDFENLQRRIDSCLRSAVLDFAVFEKTTPITPRELRFLKPTDSPDGQSAKQQSPPQAQQNVNGGKRGRGKKGKGQKNPPTPPATPPVSKVAPNFDSASPNAKGRRKGGRGRNPPTPPSTPPVTVPAASTAPALSEAQNRKASSLLTDQERQFFTNFFSRRQKKHTVLDLYLEYRATCAYKFGALRIDQKDFWKTELDPIQRILMCTGKSGGFNREMELHWQRNGRTEPSI
ncbi:hypothetical protein HDU96_003863 [Phlyctochytrium bullatum]|nr:hypothetical protein HDU96_003863 [Phlyctochytrium bullatum]